MAESDNQQHVVADHVRNLLNGSNPKDVPKKYVPKIRAILIQAKKSAISKGQANVVKQIQKILNDLPIVDDHEQQENTQNDGYSRQRSQSSLPRCKTPANSRSKPYSNLASNSPSSTTPSNYNSQSNSRNPSRSASKRTSRNASRSTSNKASPRNMSGGFSDDQLDPIIEDLVNGNSYIPENDMLPDLINYSKRKIDSLIKNNELIKAQKYENIYQQLAASQSGWNTVDSKSSKKNELAGRLSTTQHQLQEARNSMEMTLNDYDQKMESIRESFEEEWENEIQEFDKVTNGELPPSFRKFSQKLLNLRETEKFLIKSRRFEEAGYIRMEADELEEQELEQCRVKFRKARETKKMRLTEEHVQKMKCFDENCARVRMRIQNDNENKIHCLERAQSNFQNRINTLDVEIKDTLNVTPAPSQPPSRPLSPHKQANATFMTQPPTKKKAQVHTNTTVVYRPIPSKWRIQTPQATKIFK
ncbi:hypothetical protein TRFO_08941 [Tritrichomonas foetus]|uniref:Uncharacterized protein n=1 Tax=Tritrichomonas foetus TaxID=1144522 RepID=A0A1J4JGR9_9EUKA|nr:hypothetical protein TRFO_08941 [Tritrichomonas foetus]|eukprot:OHS98352.1 hypothetical protein TRFO_08941 [Tritrichomonas foetus]